MLTGSTLSASGVIVLKTEDRLLGNLFFPPSELVNAPYIQDFDLNDDGRIDFTLRKRIFTTGAQSISLADTSGTSRFVYSSERIASLDQSFLIGPTLANNSMTLRLTFGAGSEVLAENSEGLQFGEFVNFETSYLGFEFQADTGTHYGYAEITDQGANGFVIESVAWESEPGESILTGAQPAIPEPSTSVLCSICAFFLLGRRHRHNQECC